MKYVFHCPKASRADFESFGTLEEAKAHFKLWAKYNRYKLEDCFLFEEIRSVKDDE